MTATQSRNISGDISTGKCPELANRTFPAVISRTEWSAEWPRDISASFPAFNARRNARAPFRAHFLAPMLPYVDRAGVSAPSLITDQAPHDPASLFTDHAGCGHAYTLEELQAQFHRYVASLTRGKDAGKVRVVLE